VNSKVDIDWLALALIYDSSTGRHNLIQQEKNTSKFYKQGWYSVASAGLLWPAVQSFVLLAVRL